eukprot:COSAG05_NODE_504_length_9208_cov_22.420024_8_plen_117_part_00
METRLHEAEAAVTAAQDQSATRLAALQHETAELSQATQRAERAEGALAALQQEAAAQQAVARSQVCRNARVIMRAFALRNMHASRVMFAFEHAILDMNVDGKCTGIASGGGPRTPR